MADIIKPFRATYYNPAIFKNLSSVACPPYDVISKKQLSVLRRKSPYNFSNILLATNNNYKEISERLYKWLSEQVLVDDTSECIYLYEQKFNIQGKKYKRFGFLSLLKMDGKRAIFPHEYTLKAPKEDRKRILEEVKANLSPVFIMASKPLKYFHSVYNYYCSKKPFTRFKDLDGNDNYVWKIDDKDKIKKILCEINKNKLVIADGHHRFEVAYEYYKKNKNHFENLNYIMAYITDVQDGLIVLPTHRIVLIKAIAAAFLKLTQYFDIKEVKNRDSLELRLKAEKNFSFGIYTHGKFYFLKLRDESILDKLFKGSVYRKLDTYLLHQFVFPMFEIEGQIEYTHDIKEVGKMAGKDKTAFILKPASLDEVFSIANKGYRLPQKSTYFYPKVYSGIAIRRFIDANKR